MAIIDQARRAVKPPSSFPHSPYYLQLKTEVAKDKSKLKTDRRFRFYIMKGRQLCSSWLLPEEKRRALLGMLALHLRGKDHEQSRRILRNLVYLQRDVEQIAGTLTPKQLCGWVAARIFTGGE